VPGARVLLFRDLNGDGILDPDEPQIDSVLSDVNGDYLFTNLAADDYIVVADVTGVTLPTRFVRRGLANTEATPVKLLDH